MIKARHTSESAGLGASKKPKSIFETGRPPEKIGRRNVGVGMWVIHVLYFSWILQVVPEVKLVLAHGEMSPISELEPDQGFEVRNSRL